MPVWKYWLGVGLILGGGAVLTAGELIGVVDGGATITGWATYNLLVLVAVLASLGVLAWHFVTHYIDHH